MRELLKIEYLKIKHYTIFRAFMLLYICLVPLMFYAVSLFEVPMFNSGTTLFKFPNVWNYLSFVASWFTIFPAILLITLVCNEVSYKTQKQNVIDGLSRLDVILAKFYVLLGLATISVGYIFVLGLIFGLVTSGASNIFSGIESMFYFLVQTIAYLSLALLTAVIIRKASLAIFAYLIIFLFAGLIVSQMASADLAAWLPFDLTSSLVMNPWVADYLRLERMMNPTGATESVEGISFLFKTIGTIIYTGGFVFLSYVVMKKRDL